jgi:hypothetical protein
MKKRMEGMRAEQAQDEGGGAYREAPSRQREARQGRDGEHDTLEGDYRIKDDER